MKRIGLFILPAILVLAACQSMNSKGTIGGLRNKTVEIKKVKIEGGLDKAMQSYQRFLEETPDTALAPEAIRRLADLKIEKEYGTLTEGAETSGSAGGKRLTLPKKAEPPKSGITAAAAKPVKQPAEKAAGQDASDAAFEKRATQSPPIPVSATDINDPGGPADDLEKAGPLEAIVLYNKLLKEYPLYDRNDQVLYQMSRAYEELGRIEEAMTVMARLVKEYPGSRYIDEVQFRRAEYFFTHRKYLDAEEAYGTIVKIGTVSTFYELALYKMGWTFYKQELYEEAQHRFIALLDHKVDIGYDFAQTDDETERKRMDDTFRVISLGFSNLGGPDSVADYFSTYGKRSYENNVYSNLAEFYFDKRRYADATATYSAFVSRNPFHRDAPNFHMRVIEIHTAGGFPSLVLDSKKSFATTYGLKAEYWRYFDPAERPDVLKNLKTNLTDLANHYHSAYQKPRKPENKPAHFKEALHWYREFLASFPKDETSPNINYQLADLLLENHNFDQAAVEYEKTAYDYPLHEKAAEAGYAAVYALREHLAVVPEERKNAVKQDTVRSSLKFADTFPKHEKAPLVLGAAADDLYVMKVFDQALAAGSKLIEKFPNADATILRGAWLVVGHSSYELEQFSQAEGAYTKVLAMLPEDDKTRKGLVDNLAASIYKQGEQANAAEDYQQAANHFLRVGRVAPTSSIRANAEYDGATALIQLKDWNKAAAVLLQFRNLFPEHELQPEVTKKIAYVYRENGQRSLAAKEYERIETESRDDDIRREALQTAAELYSQDGNTLRSLEVYRRYVDYFPQPVEANLETRNKIADILKTQKDREAYLAELRRIVSIDASAGSERTPRTRYLAATSGLVLAEDSFEKFKAVRLVKPFEKNLRKKQDLMKQSTKAFNHLIAYEFGEITAASTFYLAEIYAHFSKALMTSERPDGLNALELEEYELAIEEQAYPFEEKAIKVHESNLQLIQRGVYNEWIDKSLRKLAVFVPARYDKTEEDGGMITSMGVYTFEVAAKAPTPPADAITQEQGEKNGAADTPAASSTKSQPGEKQADTVPSPQEQAQPAPRDEKTAVPAQDGKSTTAEPGNVESSSTPEAKSAATPTRNSASSTAQPQAVAPAAISDSAAENPATSAESPGARPEAAAPPAALDKKSTSNAQQVQAAEAATVDGQTTETHKGEEPPHEE